MSKEGVNNYAAHLMTQKADQILLGVTGEVFGLDFFDLDAIDIRAIDTAAQTTAKTFSKHMIKDKYALPDAMASFSRLLQTYCERRYGPVESRG